MQTQIHAFLETRAGAALIKVFGYASKGAPGLEIIGLGKFGKTIKEKFIYISKERQLKHPVKRFVICLEQNDFHKDLELSDVKWLEFPLLLVYWYLVGNLSIHTLNDCLCSGFIEPSGLIVHHQLSDKMREYLKSQKSLYDEKVKLISVAEKSLDDLLLIESQGLLGEIPHLKFA